MKKISIFIIALRPKPVVRSSLLAAVTLLASWIVLSPIQSSYAQSDPLNQSGSALKVEPIFNEIVANPGDTIKRQMTITNLSNFPLPMKGYVRQFVASDDQGNTNFPDNPDKKAVQQWFHIDAPDFILQPQDKHAIVLTIAVPQDAEPGGHYATLFFESLIPKEILSQTSLSLASRIGSLFFFVVSGDIHKQGNLSGFSARKIYQHGPVNFELGFTNTGNVHLHPVSTISITNWRGQTVTDIDDDGQTVLPNTSRHWSVMWKPTFAFGYYRALVKMATYPEAKTQTASITFFVIPIDLIAELVGLLSVILFIMTRGKRRLKKAYLALRGRL